MLFRSPNKIELATGEEKQFSLKVPKDFLQQSKLKIKWLCTGGEITRSGRYIAKNPGKHMVIAKLKDYNLTAKAKITVTSHLTIEILPKNTTVQPGGIVNYRINVSKNGVKRWVWPWDFDLKATKGRFQGINYFAPQQPGRYQITVEYENVKQSAWVTVKAPKIVKLAILPEQAKLRTGEKKQFRAYAYDNTGNKAPIQVKWSATGGTINSKGIFKAGSKPGLFQVKAVTSNGIKDAAYVKIDFNIKKIEVIPNKVYLSMGDKFRFKAKAYLFDGEHKFIDVKWKATEGKIDSNGNFTAKNIKNSRVKVWAYDSNGKKGFATIIIKRQKIASYLTINPERIILTPGEKQNFVVHGFTENNEKANLKLRWFATGGNVDQAGVCTAGKRPGDYDITAIDTNSHLLIGAFIRIKANKIPTQKSNYQLKVLAKKRVVEPYANFLIKPVLMYKGKQIWCWPWEFSYTCSQGIMIGEYGNVWVAPSKPGKYKVTISHKKAQKTISIIVKSTKDKVNKVYKLKLFPNQATLNIGQATHFYTKAFNARGEQIECEVKWEATGGKIDEAGNYEAADSAGLYQVWAICKTNPKIRDSSLVLIKEDTSFYDRGYNWGKSLKYSKVSKWDLQQFIIQDLFFSPLEKIEQFKEGFVKGYQGSEYDIYAVKIISSIWYESIKKLGNYYGSSLEDGNLTRQQIVKFMSKYINRLNYSDQRAFKKGFLQGYSTYGGYYIYQQLEKEAFK